MALGPVVVAFSGGIDSSVILALAVHVAREHGYALPHPVALTVPGSDDADERDWRELVLAHLGLGPAEEIDARPHLELVGEQALRILEAVGPVIPPNAHALLPILDQAHGATVITGSGGDELLDGAPRRFTSARRSGFRPTRAGLPGLLWADAPHRLLRRHLRAHSPWHEADWLRAPARAELIDRQTEDDVSVPRGWAESTAALWRTRQFHALRLATEVAGEVAGVPVLVPFERAEVFAAFAAHYGERFPGTRARMVNELAGDLLPDELIGRTSKALLGDAFFGPRTRAFAEQWDDAAGVNAGLVDLEAVRASWLEPGGDYRTSLLLQQAWLESGCP
ncbi:MAG: asparagine synthase [Solirubrobacteraceae bacterium]|nr:asparagine synthase [Solirubrobacteraceae bacterium]